MLSSVLKLDGDADKWADWDFKFPTLVASENTGFCKLFGFLRYHDGVVTYQDVEALGVNEGTDQE